ncbi:MAG: four helix bundle protein [candidate division Zixibacteria bacterium RBG_16_53_22]|nr:MAG: four helix bundle protein [candidate division Zixibacteria bacterium RBG_16_53_22]
MSQIGKFEDIEAWQKARELSKAIYDVTGEGAFARDFGLRDQIRRSAISVMSNIAEGFDRGGNKELIQFLYIAKGSIAELRAQLYIALDAGYLKQEEFQNLYDLAASTGRLLGGFIRYLRSCNPKPETRNRNANV